MIVHLEIKHDAFAHCGVQVFSYDYRRSYSHADPFYVDRVKPTKPSTPNPAVATCEACLLEFARRSLMVSP